MRGSPEAKVAGEVTLAAYEMNAFKSDYQKAIISNAKAFALALKDQGLNVEGDPNIGYTETHQVIIRVSYGKGPAMAQRLEENNIILNYLQPSMLRRADEFPTGPV